jgi:hypothetical protein
MTDRQIEEWISLICRLCLNCTPFIFNYFLV